MKKTIFLSFVLLALSCVFSSTTEAESNARRFSTSAYILSNAEPREYGFCNDDVEFYGGIQSNTGVTAVSYNWTISGNGAYISGSTTTENPNVVITRDSNEMTSYQLCVTVLGSDNNSYSKCRNFYVDPLSNCFNYGGGPGGPAPY